MTVFQSLLRTPMIYTNARLGLNATPPLIDNSDRDDLNQNAYDGD